MNLNGADTDTLVSAGHYLLAAYGACGGMRAERHTSSPAENSIRRELRDYATTLAKALHAAAPSSLLSLIPLYDVVCRAALGTAPAPDKLNDLRIRVIDAHLHGDASVSHAALASMLQPLLRTSPLLFGAGVLEYYTSLIDRWCRMLRYSDIFAGVASAENYQRFSILLSEYLSLYYAGTEEQTKRRWTTANICHNLQELDTAALRAYRRFVYAAPFDAVAFPTRDIMDRTIVAELMARPDINDFERAALQLVHFPETNIS